MNPRYGWVMVGVGAFMYIGSAAIGLGAVAIAFAFPPFRPAAILNKPQWSAS